MFLSKREEKLLAVLSYSRWKSRSTLVLQTGKSRTWVYDTLEKLLEKQLVERRVLKPSGPGRPGVKWRLAR
jgi:predicted ArsR family transcriptional regulator